MSDGKVVFIDRWLKYDTTKKSNISPHKTPVSDKYKDTAVQDGHTYGVSIWQQNIEVPFFIDKIIRYFEQGERHQVFDTVDRPVISA